MIKMIDSIDSCQSDTMKEENKNEAEEFEECSS